MNRHQLLFLILSFVALTCKKEPPPAVHIPTLTLTAVDASCTEAWLKLTTTQLPATVRLMRLTPTLQALQTLQLTTPDTLVIDEGLLPRRTYTYQLQKLVKLLWCEYQRRGVTIAATMKTVQVISWRPIP